MLNKLYLWFTNQLLYPQVLGFWSENDGGSLVVTNHDCTQMRSLGSRKWQPWDNNPSYPRLYNERLELAKPTHLSRAAFEHFLTDEGFKNPFKAFLIVVLTRPYFIALRGDLQGQYHYCVVKKDPLSNEKQTLAFIFPGTVEDLYDLLPEKETGYSFPTVGGSLGWLARLTPFSKTLNSIVAAKERLLKDA